MLGLGLGLLRARDRCGVGSAFGCVSILGTPSGYRAEGAAFVGKHTRYLGTGFEGYTRVEDLVVVGVEEDAARWDAVTPRTPPLLRHGRGRARARFRARVWARVRVRARVWVRVRVRVGVRVSPPPARAP